MSERPLISLICRTAEDHRPVPLDLICGLMLRCDAEGKLLPPRQMRRIDR